jgi:hypothetical protein
MECVGAPLFDAHPMKLPRWNAQQSLGGGRHMQGERPRCRFAITATECCPLSVGLGGRDSLPEYCWQEFVVRGVGGGEVEHTNVTKCRTQCGMTAMNPWSWRRSSSQPAMSICEPCPTCTPCTHFVFAAPMNVDGDRAWPVGGECGPFDVCVLASGERAHVHAGSGIGTAVAQQGEIKGMQRNTHDRRRTVSHRDGRAPERCRTVVDVRPSGTAWTRSAVLDSSHRTTGDVSVST